MKAKSETNRKLPKKQESGVLNKYIVNTKALAGSKKEKKGSLRIGEEREKKKKQKEKQRKEGDEPKQTINYKGKK